MMAFLAEKYARKYRIRKCHENTREPERIILPYVAVEYMSVEVEVNVDYD